MEEKLKLSSFDQEVTIRSIIPKQAIALLVFAPGAGRGIDQEFIIKTQEKLAGKQIASVAFNFIYKELGKKAPDRHPKLKQTWIDVWNYVKEKYDFPMFVSGKSMGGRIGSMTIDDLEGARGLIFFGYPYHPPGKPDKPRMDHLVDIQLPMLFIQGTRDAFSKKEIIEPFIESHPNATLHWLESGDHSWKPKKSSGRTQSDLIDEGIREILILFERVLK